MKVKLIILFLSVVLLIVTIVKSDLTGFRPVTVFNNRTVIGNLNLSRAHWSNGYATLQSLLSSPVYLNTDSKSQAVELKDIGVGIDRDRLAKLTKTCRTNVFKLFCKKTSNEKIDPVSVITVDTKKLSAFLDELEENAQFFAKNTIISFEDFSFRANTPQSLIKLDKNILDDKEIVADILTSENFSINLSLVPTDNATLQHQVTNTLISNMSYPLLIKYGGTPIYIPGDMINSFVDTEERDGLLYGKISQNKISGYLDTLHEEYKTNAIQVVHNDSVEAIRRAVLFRAANYEINNAVILPLEGNPITNGELHDVYLELVKSQQRLYRFENGRLTETYVVSTGLTWDTPSGEYEVLGKQWMTISYFGGWYMPKYLPIGTINGYLFGFHEIPYHMDGAGNIYSRDPNTMGSPATGGCIQLSRESSLELFEWAKVGTPVYIHE